MEITSEIQKYIVITLIIASILGFSNNSKALESPINDSFNSFRENIWLNTGLSQYEEEKNSIRLINSQAYSSGSLVFKKTLKPPFKIEGVLEITKSEGYGSILFLANNGSAGGEGSFDNTPDWKNFTNGYQLKIHEDHGFKLLEKINDNSQTITNGKFGFNSEENWIDPGRYKFKLVINEYNRTHENISFFWEDELYLQALYDLNNSLGDQTAISWRTGYYPAKVFLNEINISNKKAVDEINYSKTSPSRSFIISNFDWRNIVTSICSRSSFLVRNFENNIYIINRTKNLIKRLNRSSGGEISDLFFLGGKEVGSGGLGFNFTRIYREDVPEIFFPNSSVKYYAQSREKAILGSELAILKEKPLIIGEAPEEGEKFDVVDLEEKSEEEIMERIVEELKEKGEFPNHIVLASVGEESEREKVANNSGILGGMVAAERRGLVIPVENEKNFPEGKTAEDPERFNKENGVGEIKEKLKEVIEKFEIQESPEYFSKGGYITLLGVPRIIKEDPVEKSSQVLSEDYGGEESDGNFYYSDLEYGDLDSDGYIDFGVGRYPSDIELASELLLREKIDSKGEKSSNFEEEKEAFVGSRYLYEGTIPLLLYSGGGVSHGASVARILERENFNVERAVEHRANLSDFWKEFVPGSSPEVLTDLKKLKGNLLGKSLSAIAPKLSMFLKEMEYTTKGWMVALEYNLSEADLELIDLGEPLKAIEEHRYMETNQENLEEGMKNKSVVYWVGQGNGNSWKLSDGEEFGEERIPSLESDLVWDNSDLSGRKEKKLWREFLEKGSQSFIGPSSVNYDPFSSEIDTKFFKKGYTYGNSLKKAVNNFHEDWIAFDPFNLEKSGGIKAKTLRTFNLYGNPEKRKDPEIEGKNYEVERECDNQVCNLKAKIPLNFEVYRSGKSNTVWFETENHLLNSWKPIIPIKKFKYYLPKGSEVLNYSLNRESFHLKNLSLPRVRPLSFGSGVPQEKESENQGQYPEEEYRIELENIGDQKRILLVHSGLVYNQSNREAKIFENIDLNINYTSPYEVSVMTENGVSGESMDIGVRIDNNIEEKLEGKVVLKIANKNSYKTKEKEFLAEENSPREKSFEFVPNSSGNYSVEVYVLTDRGVLGPRKENFKVRKPAEINTYIFSPKNMEKNSVSQILTIIENKGEVEGEVKLKLNAGEGIVLDFLESGERKVTIGPEDHEMIYWDVIPFQTGNTTLSITSNGESKNKTLKIEEQTKGIIETIISLAEIRYSSKNHIENLESITKYNKSILKLERPEGSLVIERTPIYEKIRLEYNGSEIYYKRSSEKIVKRFIDPEGTLKVVKENGGIKRKFEGSGEKLKDKMEEYFENMVREVEKLEKRLENKQS